MESKFDFVTCFNPGLGDTLAIFTTNLPCFSNSPHFKTLRKFSSIPVFRGEGIALRTELLHGKHKGHHLFNKVRLEAGLGAFDKPRAILDKVLYKPVKNRIALSMDVGSHAAVQRQLIHPRARILYPEHRETLQKFILENPQIEFVEIGQKSFNFKGVKVKTGIGLEETINILSGCERMICMTSGLEHLAVAIGVITCGIINIPSLGKYGDMNEQEMDWICYPQVHRLHLDGENEKIKGVNKENLEEFCYG